MNSLTTHDRVRITSKGGESYVGYLYDPDIFRVLFNTRLDGSTQTYVIWYEQIGNIERVG